MNGPVPVSTVAPDARAEFVGDVLVLRTDAEGREPSATLAASVPDDADLTTVVVTPSVAARPDFAELLTAAAIEHLGGSSGALHLVTFGHQEVADRLRDAGHLLGGEIGQEVYVRLAEPPPAHSPAPAAVPAELPAVPAAPSVPGYPAVPDVVVQSAARPELAAPAQAGSQPVARATAPDRARQRTSPQPPAVPGVAPGGLRPVAGGHAPAPPPRPPLIWRPRVPAHVPPPPPKRSPADADPVARPGRATRAGWSFTEGPMIGDGLVLAGFVVEVRLHSAGFLIEGRPAAPRTVAPIIAAVAPVPPVPIILAVIGAPLTGPAAGLLLGGLADALGAPVVAADAPVARLVTGVLQTAGAFRRWYPRVRSTGPAGRPRRVELLGPLLPARPYRRTTAPVRGPRPAAGGSLVAMPATAMPGAPGASPLAEVSTDSPRLTAAARPIVPAGDSSVVVGSLDASADVGVVGHEPGATVDRGLADDASPLVAAEWWRVAPEVAALLDPQRWRAVAARQLADVPAPPPAAPAPAATLTALDGLSDEPTRIDEQSRLSGAAGVVGVAGTRREDPVAVPAPPVSGAEPPSADPGGPVAAAQPAEGPVPGPYWIELEPVADVDRAGLRSALSGSYDAHARVVTRTLSEEPGLRAGGKAAAELIPGLVAVRAYCLQERHAVNAYLRGGATADVGGTALLAGHVALGLRRLPAVLGPVFLAGPAGVDPALAYRPGDELVEPGFVDVRLRPGPLPESGFEYVIWSVNGRRLNGLGATAGAGLFPPASRFRVLAVDRPESGDAPVRVLLHDVAVSVRSPSAGPTGNERILSRLRAAAAGPRTPVDGGTPTHFLGLDGAGQRYRLRTAEIGSLPPARIGRV